MTEYPQKEEKAKTKDAREEDEEAERTKHVAMKSTESPQRNAMTKT